MEVVWSSLGPHPRREMFHGQGPNLCSTKPRVVICGEVVASPGFVLLISKRSKESETGCSHLDPSRAQPSDPCQTLQRSRVSLCLGLRLHLQRCSDATLLWLILDAHALVVQPTAQNKVFLRCLWITQPQIKPRCFS